MSDQAVSDLRQALHDWAATSSDQRDALSFVYDYFTIGGNGEGWTGAHVLAVVELTLGRPTDVAERQRARNILGDAWVDRALAARNVCSHCPTDCNECAVDMVQTDCECYTHQDEPDRRFPAGEPR